MGNKQSELLPAREAKEIATRNREIIEAEKEAFKNKQYDIELHKAVDNDMRNIIHLIEDQIKYGGDIFKYRVNYTWEINMRDRCEILIERLEEKGYKASVEEHSDELSEDDEYEYEYLRIEFDN